jgi:hypothetical protein
MDRMLVHFLVRVELMAKTAASVPSSGTEK